MKNQILYYLVDDVSETILGSFWARSESMAQKIIDSFDFKKANLSPSEVRCVYDPKPFGVCESHSDIYHMHFPEFNYKQRCLEFEVTDGTESVE